MAVAGVAAGLAVAAVGDRLRQGWRCRGPCAGACAWSARMKRGRPGCFGRKGKAADRDGPRSWNTDKMGRLWMQMGDGDRPCSLWGSGVDGRRRWGWRGGPCVGDVFDDGRAGDDVSEGAEGVLKRNR